ncbi:c-type cytochrome, partial [Nosocomiicoccus massiliensis]|uniref:c-type cytochrome n=1 Tax=Nosocomiicoccus massiliensis TaxID=1232430 RepID=UPI000694AD88
VMRYKLLLSLLALSIIIVISACSTNTNDESKNETKNQATESETATKEIELDEDGNPVPFSSVLKDLDSYSEEEQALINRGRELSDHTADLLPNNVGNRLSCASCHAQSGIGDAVNLIGVTKRFPQYSKREGREVTLEERINGCFIRSMNGTELDEDSDEMKAFIAFYEYISDGVEGEEYPFMTTKLASEELPEPNVSNGEALMERFNCTTCHGDPLADNAHLTGPALYGEHSFNDGAGMARLQQMHGYLKRYMPLGQPGTLTDQEAADLAGYLLMQDRPEFKGENLFPEGKPDDYFNKETREKIKNGKMKWTDFKAVQKYNENN